MNSFLRKEMVHVMKKIMVTLTPELEKELMQLKDKSYREKSETEMYRDLIQIGLTNAQKNMELGRREEENGTF